MVEVDEFFNEKNSSSSSSNFYQAKNIHSESNLNHVESSSSFKTESNKLGSKKSEPAFNSVHLEVSEVLDLVELWRVVPRPNYAADVN